ncbi:MAG: hypothetical protein RIA69_01135 [Cyclobacteriaceae bacterium]
MNLAFLITLTLLNLGESNTNELCLNLCAENKIDFEQHIVEPFTNYLDEVGISGQSEMERYLNYLTYLTENEDDYQLISRNLNDTTYLYNSLHELDLITTESAKYETLLKLVKKVKPKSPLTNDFKSIYKQLKKNDYNVSSALTAQGLIMALTDHNVELEQFRNLIILTIAPMAYRN